MAYPKKLEKLVGAALLRDDDFRQLLFKDPTAAAKIAGITLKEEEAGFIEEFVQHVDRAELEFVAKQLRGIPNPHGVAWLVGPRLPGKNLEQ